MNTGFRWVGIKPPDVVDCSKGGTGPMVRAEYAIQTFKARLSKTIDEAAFREKWMERSGGFFVKFRFNGTELTAINERTRWDKSREPGSGGFCNVLQMTVHDVARDCEVIDCEEVSQVNF